MKGINTSYSIKYFDKRVPEEDIPVKSLSDEVQQKYLELDSIFEEFFDENSLHLAKVYFNSYFSNLLKKRERKKD